MSARILFSVLFNAVLIAMVLAAAIGIACCFLSGRISQEEDNDPNHPFHP